MYEALQAVPAPTIEMQLLEYLTLCLNSDKMLSETAVQQLLASAGPRPLDLNVRTKDENSWPPLHLVVLNTDTPAPTLGRILTMLIHLGAAPDAVDNDGDSALQILLVLADEQKEDGEALSETILVAQVGAITALLESKCLTLTEKEIKQICRWLRWYAPGNQERKRVLDALATCVGSREAAAAWCSEEFLIYLDSADDAKSSVDASTVLSFLDRGASPRHSQNSATALLMTVLNPYNRYDELLPVFRAMIKRDPECVAIKDLYKLLPLQWAADYRVVASQHELAQPNPAGLLALMPSIVETLPASVDAGEICMKTQPKYSKCAGQVNTSSGQELRFKEGDRVFCRVESPGGKYEWEDGCVVDLWYREDCWPNNHPGAPYEVLLSMGTRVFALVDHDRIIRHYVKNQQEVHPTINDSAQPKRFQRIQKDDGSWELVDTASGKRRPIPAATVSEES